VSPFDSQSNYLIASWPESGSSHVIAALGSRPVGTHDSAG